MLRANAVLRNAGGPKGFLAGMSIMQISSQQWKLDKSVGEDEEEAGVLLGRTWVVRSSCKAIKANVMVAG